MVTTIWLTITYKKWLKYNFVLYLHNITLVIPVLTVNTIVFFNTMAYKLYYCNIHDPGPQCNIIVL